MLLANLPLILRITWARRRRTPTPADGSGQQG